MGNSSNSNKKESYILSYTNGDKYEGEVINGIREGYGTYYYHNGDKYEGWWQNNKKHGMGTLFYKDGNLYIGQWKNSEKEGTGSFYYRNGEKYYGTFKSGKKNGRGFLISGDGNKYFGYFKENKKDGLGFICYIKNNKISKENWKEGILIDSKNISSKSESNNLELQKLICNKDFDISFDNYMDDQIKFHQNQLMTQNDKLKSKFFTLEVAKYFKARIPNNYFDAMQIILMTSDLIYDNPHITEWSDNEVSEWLSRLELDNFVEVFKMNEINGLKFIKLNVFELTNTLKIKDPNEIKLILKSIDFLRIFVKLKIDYQDYIDYEKKKELENLNIFNVHFHHHSSVGFTHHYKDKDTFPSSTNIRSILTNNNTNTTMTNMIHADRKISEEIHNLSHKEDSKADEAIFENQEYVLTKMAISKIYFYFS
jgi:hypothetical protein